MDSVATIRDSLLDSVFQIGWRRTGLFQMLNRALLPVQPSIVPVIFKKMSGSFGLRVKSHIDAATLREIQIGSSFYCQVFNPFYDRKLSLEFAEKIKEYTKTVELSAQWLDKRHPRTFEFLKRRSLKGKPDLLFLPLFGTNYYVMLWDVDASGDDVSLRARAIAGDSSIGKLFAQIFAPFEEPPSIKPLVKRALDVNAKVIQYGTERIERNDELICGTKEEIERTRTITALGERAIREIVGGIYEKSSGSPLVSGIDSCAPNMMVFWKVFDRQTHRCNEYTYDVRCIIPLRQQIDIVQALSRRRDWLLSKLPALTDGDGGWQGVSRVDQHVREIIRNTGDLPVLPNPFTQVAIDAWFVAYKRSPYYEIIEAMTGPQLRHERLFCEMTLSSGIYNQRENPFGRGRLMGLQKARDCTPDEDYRAHLRAVSFRYVMALMAPDDTDLVNCSIIQVPVRVGGAPVACVAGVRRQTNVDLDIIDDDAFFYTYHYYHSISKHIVRDIRVKSRNVYGRLAGRFLEKHMMGQICHELKCDGPGDVGAMLARVNFDLAALARIFPYEMLKLVQDEGFGSEQREANVLLEMGPRSNVVPLFRPPFGTPSVDRSRIGTTRVECIANHVFDRTGNEIFIRPEVVAREMSHGALNATSTPEFAMLQQKWIHSISGK